MLTKYACGHIGFVATGRTVKAFIRVAEIRRRPVEESEKHCPICRGSDD